MFSFTVAQDPPRRLNLEECIVLAESAPSSISTSQLEMEASGYALTRSRAAFLPQVQVQNSVTYNNPQRNGDPSLQSFVALNGIREYLTVVNAQVELDTSGRLRADHARAGADRDAASARLEIARNTLKQQVTTAFYGLLSARRLRAVALQSLEEARDFETLTRKLSERGEVARADLVRASAETAFREQAARTATLAAASANRTLASFWTTKVDEPVPVEDSLEALPDRPVPPLETEPGVEAPYFSRPEFNLFDAEIRGFQADARKARSDLFPQASLVYQYGLDSNHWALSDRGYALFFNLNIPVFDWFKARSGYRQANLTAAAMTERRRVAEREYSRQYFEARDRVNALFDQIPIARDQVRLFEEDLRLSRLRYEAGEGSALEVVTAQGRLADARTNLLNTLKGFWIATADLEAAVGK
jgi:outer membrane protein TolC